MNLKVIAMLLAASVGGAVELQRQSSSANAEKRLIRHLVQPIIPELAKRLSLSGTVRIEATVAPDGTVKRTRILGGHPVLATEAEKAAQKSSFEKASTETVEIIEFRFSN